MDCKHFDSADRPCYDCIEKRHSFEHYQAALCKNCIRARVCLVYPC